MRFCTQDTRTVTLIEGDGIGPEISRAVQEIFAAAKVCVCLCVCVHVCVRVCVCTCVCACVCVCIYVIVLIVYKHLYTNVTYVLATTT